MKPLGPVRVIVLWHGLKMRVRGGFPETDFGAFHYQFGKETENIKSLVLWRKWKNFSVLK